MNNQVDEAISAYLQERNSARLQALDNALLEGIFFVPLGAPVRQLRQGQSDIPALCVKTETGTGAIPAFTALEHLQEWKPQGCQYATLSGRKLIAMVYGMAEISEILINLAGVPRGSIPRSDFQRMLALI